MRRSRAREDEPTGRLATRCALLSGLGLGLFPVLAAVSILTSHLSLAGAS